MPAMPRWDLVVRAEAQFVNVGQANYVVEGTRGVGNQNKRALGYLLSHASEQVEIDAVIVYSSKKAHDWAPNPCQIFRRVTPRSCESVVVHAE